ncbi:MAG: acyl-CoA dehydrogenase family protein [Pseudomonadota bacterium]|nr:acyl-CoA dehydrogenase family protein [Pseudomonadota bacterium]
MTWTLWDWPFLDAAHQARATEVAGFAARLPAHGNVPLAEEARGHVRRLGDAGLLDIVVPEARDGAHAFDVRALCLAREGLAYASVLADTMFAMQGLGTGPIALYGSPALRDRYLPPARRGETVAGLAISEPEAGSDVAAMATEARDDGDAYVLTGEKTWISNAGIADHYVVLARTGEGPGARGLTAMVVDADAPGLTAEPFDLIVPHPIGRLVFDGARVPKSSVIGAPGQGFKLAMATFDHFRPTVGAAAVGVARRAMDESLARVASRRMFGKTMAEIESVQTRLADCQVDIETAALAVYRAAWVKDVKGGRATREASIAKLTATEAAQRVVDAAVQLHGGMGVIEGGIVGQLYREVRPMRIYEGASEVQKLVIARDVLAEAAKGRQSA